MHRTPSSTYWERNYFALIMTKVYLNLSITKTFSICALKFSRDVCLSQNSSHGEWHMIARSAYNVLFGIFINRCSGSETAIWAVFASASAENIRHGPTLSRHDHNIYEHCLHWSIIHPDN